MMKGIASTKAETALEQARRGQRMSREEALVLACRNGQPEPVPLDELLGAASQVRQQGKGKTVTFSKKVFIPLTTLCRDYCSYCTFRKDPGQPGAHFMTPDEVLALAERGSAAGCKEALFSLGDQPEKIFAEAGEFLRAQGYSRTLDYLAAMSELVLDKPSLLPHANPGLRSEEHTSELQSQSNLVCRLLLVTKNTYAD